MKIEKGCLAVILNALNTEHIGKCVTVGHYVGEIDGYGGEWWMTDLPVIGNTGNQVHISRGKNLMRIDDYDHSSDSVTDKLCVKIKVEDLC